MSIADQGPSSTQEMAFEREIDAQELMSLSVNELRSTKFWKLKDPQNLSEDHIQKLRLLNAKLDPSNELQLDILNEKLLKLAEQDPSEDDKSDNAESPEGTPGPEPIPFDNTYFFHRFLPYEKEHYLALIADGGRPSHDPETCGLDMILNPDRRSEIISYWFDRSGDKSSNLAAQHGFWKRFRKYQDQTRQTNFTEDQFAVYKREVNALLEKRGIPGRAKLTLDRKTQPLLNDWREMQYQEHSHAEGLEEGLAKAAEELKLARARYQTALDENDPAADDIREFEVAWKIGNHGTYVIELRQQAILLEWIAEHVTILASEEPTSAETSQAPTANDVNQNHHPGPSNKRNREISAPAEDSRDTKKVKADVAQVKSGKEYPSNVTRAKPSDFDRRPFITIKRRPRTTSTTYRVSNSNDATGHSEKKKNKSAINATLQKATANSRQPTSATGSQNKLSVFESTTNLSDDPSETATATRQSKRKVTSQSVEIETEKTITDDSPSTKATQDPESRKRVKIEKTQPIKCEKE